MRPAADSEEQARVAAAYAYCERIAREHYENFPVASWLLPAPMRPHIAAIYAFARRADDFADEPGLDDAERLRLLDEWRIRLDHCRTAWADLGGQTLGGGALSPDLRGQTLGPGPPTPHLQGQNDGPPSPHPWGQTPGAEPLSPDFEGQTPAGGQRAGDDLIFCALRNTIAVHNLPPSLFHDLLSAFRQDVVTRRYATWADVLDYCRRSANPVGRLVLRVAGHDDPELDAQSDAVCTALQLTNFWQDLAIDWQRGRLYVPLEDRDRAWAADRDLDAGRITPEWQAALRAVAQRTRELYDAGRGVCDGVGGRLKWELRLTWLGGSRILEKTEAIGFDVFNRRPTLEARDAPILVWDAIRWSKPSA